MGKKMISKIVELLEEMNENQLKNVYDYVCNESAEENHEKYCLETIERLSRQLAKYEIEKQ